MTQPEDRMGLASSFTMYYGLMLALISIPLILVFVVLFIRAVFDYRVYIFSGGVFLAALGVFLLYRYRKRFKKKILDESTEFMEAVRSAAAEGQSVQISILGGLMNVTYSGGNGIDKTALGWEGGATKALPAPDMVDHKNGTHAPDVIDLGYSLSSELEALHRLKQEGVLSDEEYEAAKQRLLKNEKIDPARKH